jgi:antitoxin component of MazEF toxin-antitoxin module
MLQKIIRVGNSLAITLPKSFIDKTNFKAGDEVVVQTNVALRAVYVRAESADTTSGLTPEFKEWLDDIERNESDIIKTLAKA